MSSGSAVTEQRDIIKDVHDSAQRALRTTTSGTLVPAPAGETKLIYGEVLTVAIHGSAEIINYTVSPLIVRYLQKIYISGTQVGTYIVKINDIILLTLRTAIAQMYQSVDFATGSAFGIKLIAGDNIKIEATNEGNNLADFNITLQSMEVL